MPKKTSSIPGGRRVTSTNKYDKVNAATDVDVDKNGNVVSIVDHTEDGKSHSHKVESSIFDKIFGGFSKGPKKKD